LYDLPDSVLHEVFRYIAISYPRLAPALGLTCQRWNTIFRNVLDDTCIFSERLAYNESLMNKSDMYQLYQYTRNENDLIRLGFTNAELPDAAGRYPHDMIWAMGYRYVRACESSTQHPSRPKLTAARRRIDVWYPLITIDGTFYQDVVLRIDLSTPSAGTAATAATAATEPGMPARDMNRREMRATARGKKGVSRGQRQEWKGQRRRR
jgi:hypothetical protein